MDLFGQNLQVDMIHFERAKILKEIQDSRKQRRHFCPAAENKPFNKLSLSLELNFKQKMQALANS